MAPTRSTRSRGLADLREPALADDLEDLHWVAPVLVGLRRDHCCPVELFRSAGAEAFGCRDDPPVDRYRQRLSAGLRSCYPSRQLAETQWGSRVHGCEPFRAVERRV